MWLIKRFYPQGWQAYNLSQQFSIILWTKEEAQKTVEFMNQSQAEETAFHNFLMARGIPYQLWWK